MTEFDEIKINKLRELQVGDVVTLAETGSAWDLRVRRTKPVVLPTEEHTTIRSTWKNTGGIADFDATLQIRSTLGGRKIPTWVVLDDGTAYRPEELAAKINYFIIKGVPVEESEA